MPLPSWLAQKPTVVVQHAELVANPYGAVRKLYTDLVAAGVHGLTLPTEAQVARLIKPSTHEAHRYLASEQKTVGEKALAVSKALLSNALPATQLPPATWHVAPRKHAEAVATLLTTDNKDYLRGALVLGSSIRSFDSSRDMVRGSASRHPLPGAAVSESQFARASSVRLTPSHAPVVLCRCAS